MTEADAEMQVLIELGVARHRAERLVLASADVELPPEKVVEHKKKFAQFIQKKAGELAADEASGCYGPANVLRARVEGLNGES